MRLDALFKTEQFDRHVIAAESQSKPIRINCDRGNVCIGSDVRGVEARQDATVEWLNDGHFAKLGRN